jgi:hypothetical protein
MTHPIDSGTQPAPHYCTQRLTDDGTIAGCPDWPECLFPQSRERVIAAERLREAKCADWSRMWRDLGILAGWAFGAVLVFGIVVLLLPVFG